MVSHLVNLGDILVFYILIEEWGTACLYCTKGGGACFIGKAYVHKELAAGTATETRGSLVS